MDEFEFLYMLLKISFRKIVEKTRERDTSYYCLIFVYDAFFVRSGIMLSVFNRLGKPLVWENSKTVLKYYLEQQS